MARFSRSARVESGPAAAFTASVRCGSGSAARRSSSSRESELVATLASSTSKTCLSLFTLSLGSGMVISMRSEPTGTTLISSTPAGSRRSWTFEATLESVSEGSPGLMSTL